MNYVCMYVLNFGNVVQQTNEDILTVLVVHPQWSMTADPDGRL